MVRLHLLGGLRVEVDGSDVAPAHRSAHKARLLLAILATGAPRPRPQRAGGETLGRTVPARGQRARQPAHGALAAAQRARWVLGQQRSCCAASATAASRWRPSVSTDVEEVEQAARGRAAGGGAAALLGRAPAGPRRRLGPRRQRDAAARSGSRSMLAGRGGRCPTQAGDLGPRGGPHPARRGARPPRGDGASRR